MAPTINDVERSVLAGKGLTGTTLNDLRYAYWRARSGLSLSNSCADHMRSFLPGTGSIQDREIAWYRSLGAVGITYQDVKYDMYANKAGSLP